MDQPRTAGSLDATCADCGRALTLAAGGGARAKAQYPSTPVICLACFDARVGQRPDMSIVFRRLHWWESLAILLCPGRRQAPKSVYASQSAG